MLESELNRLRDRHVAEIERRKKLADYLNDEKVKEFVKLMNIGYIDTSLDELKTLRYILREMHISPTNNIYVCILTGKYDYSEDVYNVNQAKVDTDFNDPQREFRYYKNIEDGTIVTKIFNSEYDTCTPSFFENKNVVLNPTNSCINQNDYQVVREEFILNSMKYGQETSKKLLLEKYPRI